MRRHVHRKINLDLIGEYPTLARTVVSDTKRSLPHPSIKSVRVVAPHYTLDYRRQINTQLFAASER